VLVELEQNYKHFTWNLHKCMNLLVPSVTILFLLTLVTAVTIFHMVNLLRFLPRYHGYQNYPCCYGKCVCFCYKFINISMVSTVKRTPRTFFALRTIFYFVKNKTSYSSLNLHNRTEVYLVLRSVCDFVYFKYAVPSAPRFMAFLLSHSLERQDRNNC
jgi:hypothetical protein